MTSLWSDSISLVWFSLYNENRNQNKFKDKLYSTFLVLVDRICRMPNQTGKCDTKVFVGAFKRRVV